MSIRISVIYTWLFGLACVITSISCKKLLNVPPPQAQVSTADVFSSDTNALSAVTGMYIQAMDNPRGLLNGGLSIYCGLSSDELANSLPNPGEDAFRTNGLRADNVICGSLYNSAYGFIHIANTLLTELNASKAVSDNTKAQLSGEAKFFRALVYFYLVNLYGGVPLVTTADYTTSAGLPRATTARVYQQILDDLHDAQRLLSMNYPATTAFPNDRTRPNRAAATALLARVYLYLGQAAQADSAASAVIASPMYRLETSLDSVFLSGSREAIWQLQPVNPGVTTAEAGAFVPGQPGVPAFYTATNFLLMAFEPGDQRRVHWLARAINGKFYPFKYKRTATDSSFGTEYDMVLRLGEVYLIRAEARALEGDNAGAAVDLDAIRSRAGLAPVGSSADLPTAILHERQVELMAEWGHRWLDVKRTGQADAILGTEKYGWKSTAALYPLPATELINNPSLVQNVGY